MDQAQNGKPILSEGGIVITEWHISASGQRFAWGDLGFVQIAKPSGWLVRVLGKEGQVYQLRVARKGKPAAAAKAIFCTEDLGFVGRIQEAINEVARRRGGRREV